jgi:exodeoxyribonuclease-3
VTRLLTWNVNSLRARSEHVERVVRQWSPDILCLQETKIEDAAFPHDWLASLGYPHRVAHGQRTYNGVAIASRIALRDVAIGLAGEDGDDQARLVSADVAGLRVIDVYVPNGQAVGTDKFRYKLRWLDRLAASLRDRDTTAPLALVGDFNIAPDDLDVWDPFVWDGVVLCHPEERKRLRALLDLGLVDAWRARNALASEFSWWDYQRMGWPRNQGLRIDLVLLGAAAQARCSDIRILREVRGWPGASDHAPVLATFDP